jgi:arsenate reductase
MCVIYHNSRCSKSRATLKILEEKGVNVTIINYLEQTPNQQELSDLLDAIGLKPSQFIRKGEDIFKELNLQNASENELLKAMVRYPKLIERPIVKTSKGVKIGRPPESVLEIL